MGKGHLKKIIPLLIPLTELIEARLEFLRRKRRHGRESATRESPRNHGRRPGKAAREDSTEIMAMKPEERYGQGLGSRGGKVA